MILTLFVPVPTLTVDNTRSPLLDTFTFLKEHMQRYDVVLIDPNCDSVSPMEWDYYARLYFPEGLGFVTSPEGYRRIWYVVSVGKQDTNLENAVRQNRVPGVFVGPSQMLARLYEGPPDDKGIAFENGLRFHGAEFVGSSYPGMMVVRDGEPIRMRLWWSVDKPLGNQYSIGLYVLRNGQLVIQSDGPQESESVPKYTDSWKPGQYYVEERDFTIPNSFPTGTYPVYIAVYQPWDNTRLSVPGADANKLLAIGRFSVKSWS